MNTKKKIWITSGVIAALAAIYTCGGFWGVPYAINWGLKKYADPFLDRQVTTESVKFNPFSLHLEVRGLKIQKKDNPPLVQLALLDGKISWQSLFRFSPIISQLKLDGFDATVIRTGLDTFNFSDIIQKIVNMPESPESDNQSSDPMQFEIDNVTLSNSKITLDDKFRGKVDQFTDINLTVPLISNFKKEVDTPVQPKLQFKFNDEPFTINASSELFIPSLKTGVDFTLEGLNLENAASFNPVPINMKVAQGKMDAALNLDFAKTVDKNEGYLRLRGTLKIRNLSLQDNLTEPYEIAHFREININLKEFSLFRQILKLGEVQFQEPKFTIIRNTDGLNVVNLATHIVKEEAVKTPSGTDAEAEVKTQGETAVKTEPAVSSKENGEPQPANSVDKAESAPVREEGSAAQNSAAPASEPTQPHNTSTTSVEPTPTGSSENSVVQTASAKEVSAEAAPTETSAKPSEPAAPAADQSEESTTAAAKDPDAQPDIGWKWSIEKASIRNGTVNFKDQTNGFTQVIGEVNTSVTALSSTRDHKSDVTASLNALGGALSAKGSVEVNPVKADLTLSAKDLAVPEAMPYIAEFTAAKVPSGLLSVESTLALDADQDVNFSMTGEASLSDLTIDEPNGAKAISAASVKASGIEVRGADPMQIKIADIDIAQPTVRLVLGKSGTVNLMSLAQAPAPRKTESTGPAPAPATKTAGKAAAKSAPLSWEIDKIRLAGGTVNFSDESNGFHKDVTAIQASVGPLTGKDVSSSFNASLAVLGGTISADGSFHLSPFKTQLSIETNKLSIADLTPYIAQYSGAHILKGSFSNKGKFSITASNPLTLTYGGSAAVANLSVADRSGAQVFTLNQLNASGIDVSGLSPLSIGIGTLVIDSPYAQIVKDANGQYNIASLASPSTKGSSAAASASESKQTASNRNSKAKASSSSSMPLVTLGKVQLSKGRIRYTDNSVKPRFRLNATNLNGSMTGFSTAKNANAAVDIKGLLDGTPMELAGKVNPFGSQLSLAMKGSVKSLSLPTFSPLAAGVTGYPITQGQMTYKGTVTIEKDELKSENAMIINKLAFGPEVPNAKETLPVGLAVSLLQDRSGQIDLNLPVTGSLNDPDFSVGGIVVKMIVNLISKAVTAPFALIGSMFDLGNVDLHNLPFPSGTARLDDQTQKALKILAKVMRDRPGLKIKIIGEASPEADDAGLKERLLNRDMRITVFRDTTSAIQSRQLTDAQINSAIRSLYQDSPVPNKPELKDTAEMKEFLLSHQRVATADLINLADRRAAAVRNYLIQTEKIDPDRLFIVTSRTVDGGKTTSGVSLGIQD